MNVMRLFGLMLWFAMLLGASIARAQEDVADVPSQALYVTGNEQQRYFLIGLSDGRKAPAGGYGLLLVLPGGDGGPDFNPFVKRIWKNALPPGSLIAQLLAVPSDNPKQIVWPTAKAPDPKQTFATEDFLAAVVKDVKAKQPINEAKVFALAWSSGGPAVYTAMLLKETPLKGAFVAMSVFVPLHLPPLANAKGRAFYLLQSPQDQVTRYSFAQAARMQLGDAGAKVKLTDYDGGHGWHGDVFGNIRGGIEWLEKADEGGQ
jgi:predicted esterase